MDNSSNMLQLCRLCLVKDDVNIPIFEEQGDIRQIFLKISSCLPVKVSQDDRLPKKICDGCSYKLDMLYEFWNSSANAEKQLLTWLGEAGMTSQMTDGTISAVAQQIKPADALVKQETIDPPDINHSDDDEDDDKTYMFNKQEEKVSKNNIDEPPPKRQRRTAAVKAAIAMDQNSDDDDDSGEPMTKMEDDSDDSDNDDHEPAFVDVPSTSADDQPGPSGMGKDGVDAPYEQENSKTKPSRKLEIQKNVSENTDKESHRENKNPRNKETVLNHPPCVKFEEPINCENCSASYYTNVEFALHSILHSEDRKFVCHICNNYRSTNKYTIEMHVRGHEGTTNFKCEICNKTFTTRYYAREHKNFHTGEKPHKCLICDKNFMYSYQLRSHRRTSHYEIITGLPLVKFDCNICKKHYESHTGLQQHKMTVHNNGDLTVVLCEICGKTLSTKEKLKFHMRTHTGDKPYTCEYCEKCFSKKHQMIQHMRVHTGEKPYICLLCGREFSQRTHLVLHEATHTRERPYVCESSGK